MNCTMHLTRHARQQMANRSVRIEDIEYVLDHGRVYEQREGRTAFYCGRETANAAARNLAVIIGPNGSVITAIRTASPKRIRLNGAQY
jgi:hypothetical protein